MRRTQLTLSVCLALLFVPSHSRAQSEEARLLAKARSHVVALRVTGRPKNDFKPPIVGTGFLIATADGTRRIITARHVVRIDEDWEPAGLGVSRDVYPYFEGIHGPTGFYGLGFEGYRGVAYHQTKDAAQVNFPPPGNTFSQLGVESFTETKRYYVVSWGQSTDNRWPSAPYVRTVKYIASNQTYREKLKSDEHVFFEILNSDNRKQFFESESGSPIYNADGRVVAILTNKILDEQSQTFKIGAALPTSALQDWIEAVQSQPVLEPKLVKLRGRLFPAADAGRQIPELKGTCIFLGKSSARNQDENNPKAPGDIPFGVRFLKELIGRFPDEAPMNAPTVLQRNLERPDFLRVSAKTGALNARSRCPDVIQKPGTLGSNDRRALYGTPVSGKEITPAFGIQVQVIYRMSYLDDFFFWGVVERIWLASE